MDPTATWAEIVRLARAVLESADDMSDDLDVYSMSEELAQHIVDLNEWITVKGGFLPNQFVRDW